MNFNERQRQRRLQTCKHFNGIQHKTCRAGVAYCDVEAAAPPMTGRHLPCLPNIKSDACEGECASREFPTGAEVAAEEEDINRRIGNTLKARGAIVAAIGPFKKGRPGESGDLACPICGSGKIHYSRSGYNGHIHAMCSSANCVSWME